MALEAASYISQLNEANPSGADPYSSADDHLRLIKGVLKTQFPSLGTAAVNATAAELNKLSGFGSGNPESTANKNQANGYAGLGVDGKLLDTAVKQSNVTQHQTALQVAWGQLTGIPTSFAPSAHTHSYSEITGLNVITSTIKATAAGGEVINQSASTQLVSSLNYGLQPNPSLGTQTWFFDLQMIYGTNVNSAADMIIYMFHKGYMQCHGEVTNLNTGVSTAKEISGQNTFFELHRFIGTTNRFRLRLRGALQIIGSGVVDPWGGFWSPAVFNSVSSGALLTVEGGSYATWQRAA